MKKYWIAITCALLIATGGMLNGVMDKLQFHYGTSVFPKGDDETLLGHGAEFWNPSISWKNKYKDWPNDKRPKFIGATTFLVSLTDAWHFIKTLMMICYHTAILLPLVYYYNWPRWLLLAPPLVNALIFGTAHTIMFKYLLAA